MDNIIELKGIGKSYNSKDYIVRDINLTVRKGEFVTLLGPSGCGKTTTLRMIAGFETPTEGSILFEGKDISKVPPYLRPVNTVFQRYALFPHLNVYNNIAFGLNLKKLPKKEIAEKVSRVLDIVDMEGFEKRKINTLSGGQQQRIAIARAIVNEPEILLLDEPLGALDLKMRKEMQLELKQMHENIGITFIYVTHDQEEALTMSDKIVVMADGAIQQTGTPEEVYNEPSNAFVADFIGESNIFNGVMSGNMKVKFLGAEFECLDDIEKGAKVDVVVRPEDIVMVPYDEGKVKGEVISVIFKGIHYEITVQSGKNEIVVQRTKAAVIGDKVGITLDPDSIHCMKREKNVNRFEGVLTKKGTVMFADGEFECNVSMLYPGSEVDEEGNLTDSEGNIIEYAGTSVIAEISFDDIRMSDDADEGGVCGNIFSLIYKGDHYNYIIKTENGYEYILNDEYLWNENDYVSIVIPKEAIKLMHMDSEV